MNPLLLLGLGIFILARYAKKPAAATTPTGPSAPGGSGTPQGQQVVLTNTVVAGKLPCMDPDGRRRVFVIKELEKEMNELKRQLDDESARSQPDEVYIAQLSTRYNDVWNTMKAKSVEHAAKCKKYAEDFAKRRKQGTPATPAVGPRDTDVIRVRNMTGDDRLEGEVLRIGEKIIDNLDKFHIWHEGLICNGCGDWGIAIRAMPYDGIDQLQVSGVCLALVDVTEEGHTWAGEKIGETHLVSDTQGGAKILWKESGIGLKVAVVNLGPHPRLGLFQLGGEWEAGGGGSSSGEPCAPTGWMRMEDCTPIMFFDGACSYAPHSDPETLWHAAGYLGQFRGDLLSLGASLNYVLPKYGCGDYVWCFWNDHECRWQIIGPPEDHIRFELAEALLRGGSAAAKLRILVGGSYITTDVDLTVHDAHELVDACNGYALGYGIAKWMNDGCRLEVIGIGNFCEDSSSSSSSSSGCPLTFDYDRIAVDGCYQTITHMRLTHNPKTCDTSSSLLSEETYSGCPSPSVPPCEFTIDYDTVALGGCTITVTHRRKTVDLYGCTITDTVLGTDSLNVLECCCDSSSSSSSGPPSSSGHPSSSGSSSGPPSSSVCCECPLNPLSLDISGTVQNDGLGTIALDSNPSTNIYIYKTFIEGETIHIKIDCADGPDGFTAAIAVGDDPDPEDYGTPVAFACGAESVSGTHTADFGDGDGSEEFDWGLQIGWSSSCPNLDPSGSSSGG